LIWLWALLAAAGCLAALTFMSLLGKTKQCCDDLLHRRWQVRQREQRREAQTRARSKAKTSEPPIAPERPKPVAPSMAEPVAVAE